MALRINRDNLFGVTPELLDAMEKAVLLRVPPEEITAQDRLGVRAIVYQTLVEPLTPRQIEAVNQGTRDGQVMVDGQEPKEPGEYFNNLVTENKARTQKPLSDKAFCELTLRTLAYVAARK